MHKSSEDFMEGFQIEDAEAEAPGQDARRAAGEEYAAFRAQLYVPADEHSCILWNGPVDGNGYGIFKSHGRTKRAHWYAYEVMLERPLSSSAKVTQACGIRTCVRLDHLEAQNA